MSFFLSEVFSLFITRGNLFLCLFMNTLPTFIFLFRLLLYCLLSRWELVILGLGLIHVKRSWNEISKGLAHQQNCIFRGSWFILFFFRSAPSPLISFKPYFLTGSYHTMLFISAFLGRLECVLFPFIFLLVPRPITSGKMGLERGLRCVLRTVL